MEHVVMPCKFNENLNTFLKIQTGCKKHVFACMFMQQGATFECRFTQNIPIFFRCRFTQNVPIFFLCWGGKTLRDGKTFTCLLIFFHGKFQNFSRRIEKIGKCWNQCKIRSPIYKIDLGGQKERKLCRGGRVWKKKTKVGVERRRNIRCG